MIERETHKEILKQDYEKQREAADKLRERGEAEKAAEHYRKAAGILEKMAELEQSGPLSEKRRELAENLRNGADKLTSSGWSPEEDDIDESEPDKTGTRKRKHDGSEDETDAANYLQEPPSMDFDDVGGMTDLKQTLEDKVVDPLERSDLYEEYDLGVVNGVLLHGPPGTGKTYITRALAGKLGYNFIEVTPTDITSSLVGEAADNVAELFEVAQENQPCIVFIDEIDAIAGKRSGGASKTQSERQMVNQLLTELNEIQNEDVVVVAATNRMGDVDDAIKRSGRFDERIEVPLPDDKARAAILRVHLRERPVLPDKIDWEMVKAKTQGYSASDMELIATNAARKALQEAQEEGEIQKISQRHIDEAIEETEPSV
jgi:transitional endoplasmic reticulum ATPase